jgi:flagellar biosynthesis protein FlhG
MTTLDPACATRLIAVASGKGGVGKTLLAVNLALALRDRGHSCLLVDLDWGLANVDVALGLAPSRHVGHVLAGECSLEQALLDYGGLTILPNACGSIHPTQQEPGRRAALLKAVHGLLPRRQFVIADTHPGIESSTVEVLREAHATLVVTTPEPTALTDTYALFKVLSEAETRGPLALIVNQASSAQHADETAGHLDGIARRFLGRGITTWGHVLSDAAVPRAVARQRALLDAAPRSSAARGIREIALRVAAMSPAGLGPA